MTLYTLLIIKFTGKVTGRVIGRITGSVTGKVTGRIAGVLLAGLLAVLLAGVSSSITQGVIPGGAGGPQPPNFWPTTLFSGFSHTTDRKVPSEVVLMGSFMSVIYGNVQ